MQNEPEKTKVPVKDKEGIREVMDQTKDEVEQGRESAGPIVEDTLDWFIDRARTLDPNAIVEIQVPGQPMRRIRASALANSRKSTGRE